MKTVHDLLAEDWQEFTCADCNPEHDSPGDESGYEKPYVLLLPEGESAPDYCPRCGDYLSFIDGVKGLRITNTPAERGAARKR